MKAWGRALFLACVLAGGAAHAEVRLQVLESFTAAPATLGHWEPYYLRIGYVSDQPIRVRVEPRLGDAAVPGMNGGSPVNAAGSGEAFYWIAYTDRVRVDRLVVYAQDEKWQGRLAQVEWPVDLAWSGDKAQAARTPPEWVQRLKGERAARDRIEYEARMSEPAGWGWSLGLFAAAWSIPVYFILQGFLLWRWRGGWRIAAAIPAVPMTGFLLHAIFAFVAGSNLFPLFLIFLCPPALLYLLVLLGARKARVGAFVA